MCQRGHCILLGLWGEAGESSGTRMLNQQVGQKREEDREVLVPSRHLWAFCLLGVEQAGLSAVEMLGVAIWDVGVSGGESSGLHHCLTDRWMCKAAVQIEHDGDWEEVERPGRQIDLCFYRDQVLLALRSVAKQPKSWERSELQERKHRAV